MYTKDLIKYLIKLLIVIYASAVFGFLIKVSTSNSKYNFSEAFSPLTLFNEIISGNNAVLFTTILGTVFFVFFNYFRKTKVDYNKDSMR
jgi:hypothetical protein